MRSIRCFSAAAEEKPLVPGIGRGKTSTGLVRSHLESLVRFEVCDVLGRELIENEERCVAVLDTNGESVASCVMRNRDLFGFIRCGFL